jgi:hypothetical protein
VPTPRPSLDVAVEDLTGLWQWREHQLWNFAPDGRWWADTHGALAGDPGYSGTWELDGTEVHLVYRSGPDECPAGSRAAILITNLSEGHVGYEVTAQDCYPEAVGLSEEYVRYSPDNVFEHVVPSPLPAPIPFGQGNARGDWQIFGTSTIVELSVELDGTGSYWWDSEGELAWSPQETGTLRFTDEGLELTAQESGICEQGARLTLRDGNVHRGGGGATYFFVLKAVAEDECGRIAGDVTWLLIVV